VGRSLFGGGEDARRLHHIIGTGRSPLNFGRIATVENRNRLSVDDELSVGDFDRSVKVSVRRVVLEHVDHVLQVDEGVVDRHHVHIVTFQRRPGHQSADAPETIDTNIHHFDKNSQRSVRQSKSDSKMG